MQQNAQSRNNTLNTTRLSNGKIGKSSSTLMLLSCPEDSLLRLAGNGPGWGFNVPMGGAPGLPNMQPRNVGGANVMGSFAQSIGGAQSGTSLDLS